MQQIYKLPKAAKIFLLTLLVCVVMYATLEAMDITAAEFKSQLVAFKEFCLKNPINGYAIFLALIIATTIFVIPIEMVFVLLAGVVYGFWTGVALVTISRLLAAAITFLLVRKYMYEASARRKKKEKHYLLRKFEKHPNLGHFVARLAPLPDSMVNYTVAATNVRGTDYLLISLIGMIPFTLACVWMGDQLGTVSKLVHWLQ